MADVIERKVCRVLKKYICTGFSFSAYRLNKRLIGNEITSKHEVEIQFKEKNNIILYKTRKSIYWTRSSINTLFVIYIEKFFKNVFELFYNFLPTSVVGSEREQGLSLLGGHGRR